MEFKIGILMASAQCLMVLMWLCGNSLVLYDVHIKIC